MKQVQQVDWENIAKKNRAGSWDIVAKSFAKTWTNSMFLADSALLP